MTEWQWWFSQDREAWQGPFTAKDIAISEGRGQYEANESFYVCEAQLEDYRQLTIDPAQALEQVADAYEEFGGVDGEPLFSAVTTAQENDLGISLTAVLHEWIEHQNIKTGILSFADTRNEEVIEPAEKTE